jgi:hypothetical protein
MSGTIASGFWTNALVRIALVTAAALLPRAAAAAPKVDVVYLGSGDRLTCEIKQLRRGLVRISTDPADGVNVHWGTVAGVTSPREFEVTLESGDRYYGALGRTAVAGELVILVGATAVATVKIAEVTELTPIGGGVWSRIDGNLDAGFSFAQANLETHWTVNGAATYRSRKYLLSSSVASQLTAREDADKTLRNTVTLSGNRLFEGRWFANVLGQAQQNEELDLDLRTVVGGGLGKTLSQSNRRLISGFVGVVYTREQFVDQPITNTAELAVGGQLDFFTSRSNDFTLTNSVVSYYTSSRVRVESQSAWRHEFLKDFYWSLNGIESFDSDPPENGKRNDFSLSIAIGWSF